MEKDSRIIDALGGPSAVARHLDGEVTPQAVSQWRKNGIPSGWRHFLRTKFPTAFGADQPETGTP